MIFLKWRLEVIKLFIFKHYTRKPIWKGSFELARYFSPISMLPNKPNLVKFNQQYYGSRDINYLIITVITDILTTVRFATKVIEIILFICTCRIRSWIVKQEVYYTLFFLFRPLCMAGNEKAYDTSKAAFLKASNSSCHLFQNGTGRGEVVFMNTVGFRI